MKRLPLLAGSLFMLVWVCCTPAFADRAHQTPIEDFALNQLNKNNTYMSSESYEVPIGEYRFRVGLWPSEVNGTDHPFPALIVWTASGWRVLAKGPLIYDDNLNMNMPSPEEDLANFMWFIEQQFNPAVTLFLAETGSNEVPVSNVGKVLYLMATVRVVNEQLVFTRAIEL